MIEVYSDNVFFMERIAKLNQKQRKHMVLTSLEKGKISEILTHSALWPTFATVFNISRTITTK